MLSTQQIIDRLEGLAESREATEWECGFIQTLVKYKKENRVGDLSTKQTEIMQRIFDQYFAA
jgi:hypothetical protein